MFGCFRMGKKRELHNPQQEVLRLRKLFEDKEAKARSKADAIRVKKLDVVMADDNSENGRPWNCRGVQHTYAIRRRDFKLANNNPPKEDVNGVRLRLQNKELQDLTEKSQDV